MRIGNARSVPETQLPPMGGGLRECRLLCSLGLNALPDCGRGNACAWVVPCPPSLLPPLRGRRLPYRDEGAGVRRRAVLPLSCLCLFQGAVSPHSLILHFPSWETITRARQAASGFGAAACERLHPFATRATSAKTLPQLQQPLSPIRQHVSMCRTSRTAHPPTSRRLPHTPSGW